MPPCFNRIFESFSLFLEPSAQCGQAIYPCTLARAGRVAQEEVRLKVTPVAYLRCVPFNLSIWRPCLIRLTVGKGQDQRDTLCSAAGVT